MADTNKTAAKTAAKEAKQQVQNTKPAKDHWFTLSGIRKEAKRVRWPQWKGTSSNPGIIDNAANVIVFTGSFALFFVLCGVVVTYLLKFIGIGA